MTEEEFARKEHIKVLKWVIRRLDSYCEDEKILALNSKTALHLLRAGLSNNLEDIEASDAEYNGTRIPSQIDWDS